MELELIEPFPVPRWEDAALHEQARELAEWVRTMLEKAGFDTGVFDRRVDRHAEMSKLLTTLMTYGRTQRIQEPAIVWTAIERFHTVDQNADRNLWMSAVVRAFYADRFDGEKPAD